MTHLITATELAHEIEMDSSGKFVGFGSRFDPVADPEDDGDLDEEHQGGGFLDSIFGAGDED